MAFTCSLLSVMENYCFHFHENQLKQFPSSVSSEFHHLADSSSSYTRELYIYERNCYRFHSTTHSRLYSSKIPYSQQNPTLTLYLAFTINPFRVETNEYPRSGLCDCIILFQHVHKALENREMIHQKPFSSHLDIAALDT